DCIARPGEGAEGLILHLESVAAGCGDKSGEPKEKLAFLAGLAHDIAKAAADWQDYIPRRPSKGPSPCPLGAALFAYWAECLISQWVGADRAKKKALFDLAVDWIRVIYRHHGAFDDLDTAPPWLDPGLREDLPALLQTCDLEGIDAFIQKHFPECRRPLIDFSRWFAATDRRSFKKVGHYAQHTARPGLWRELNDTARDTIGLRLAELGARLIYADRHDAAEWEPDRFDVPDADAAIEQHAQHCCEEAEK